MEIQNLKVGTIIYNRGEIKTVTQDAKRRADGLHEVETNRGKIVCFGTVHVVAFKV